MAKILRKSQGMISKIKCFCLLLKNRYYDINAFRLLKTEFKFEYKRLKKKV